MSRSPWFPLLVAAPPALMTAAWIAVIAFSWMTGQHPLWNAVPRNLVEAAALRDGAAVVRLVERGEDPNRRGDIRPDILPDDDVTLTPLEAAAGAREAAMVQLLLELGAVFDASTWQRAWCISNAPSVRELLAAHRPPGAADSCGSAGVDR